MIRVKGKTSEEAEEEDRIYSFNVIYVKPETGTLLLDGTTNPNIQDITLDESTETYEVGNANDIGTASEYAKNGVVLKIEGNLTINEGVTLTSIGGDYGGPKGLFIYCTGAIINNGKIDMTSRGAFADGENVYLFKNIDGSFEYIPGECANGGAQVSNHNGGTVQGKSGLNGISVSKRATGGGGSGCARRDYYPNQAAGSSYGGIGGVGTSYSGGCGGRRS